MIHLCFRGELYYADLGHGIGSEQEGCRPVVILQNDVGNAYSPTTIIAPISRRCHTKANLPTHYPIEPVAGLIRSCLQNTRMLSALTRCAKCWAESVVKRHTSF